MYYFQNHLVYTYCLLCSTLILFVSLCRECWVCSEKKSVHGCKCNQSFLPYFRDEGAGICLCSMVAFIYLPFTPHRPHSQTDSKDCSREKIVEQFSYCFLSITIYYSNFLFFFCCYNARCWYKLSNDIYHFQWVLNI